MKRLLRISSSLLNEVRSDLRRPHAFAHERVGFLFCRAASLPNGFIVLAENYLAVSDDNYIPQNKMGALINATAFRCAMQRGLSERVGIFHVHSHGGRYIPRPSPVDIREARKFVPDFFNITPSMPHGTVILSRNAAYGLCWDSKSAEPETFDSVHIVGLPIQLLDFQK